MRADCLRCGQEYGGSAVRECRQCRRLPWIEGGRAFGRYRGALGTLLRRYKYGPDPSLAPGLAALLERVLPALHRQGPWDSVVPVATHAVRLRHRGFDHVELMARRFSRRTGIPLRRNLKRHGDPRPQAGLTEPQRRRNVKGVFSARGKPARSVLLVDDIFTTGATLHECARVLRRAGADRVTVLTVARAE